MNNEEMVKNVTLLRQHIEEDYKILVGKKVTPAWQFKTSLYGLLVLILKPCAFGHIGTGKYRAKRVQKIIEKFKQIKISLILLKTLVPQSYEVQEVLQSIISYFEYTLSPESIYISGEDEEE